MDLFDFAPVGYMTFDLNTLIVEVNLTAVDMFGHERTSLIGKPMHLYVSKKSHDDLFSHFRGIFKGLTLSVEIELVHSSGNVFPAELKSVPIKDKRDQITHCRTAVSDITERRKTEQKLRQLSQAVEQSPSVAIITDKKGNIEYVNHKFTTLTGYSFNEVIGKNPRILKSGKTSQEEYQYLWNTITSGNEWRGEFYNIKKNGEPYWEAASISPIKAPDGTITHFLAVKEDITEKKKIEAYLKESEELHRITLGSISDAIFITNDEGMFTYICPGIDVIFGYSFKEVQALGNIFCLLGKNLFNHEELKQKGEIRNIERDIKDKNKQNHTLLINVKSVFIKNGTILYTCHDITELKKADKKLKEFQAQVIQAEKMGSLGTMVAGIAHELINPIMGILNYIEYCLKKMSPQDEKYAILCNARRETNRCSGIIENLLTFSHMEIEGEQGFQKESCTKILEQVLNLQSYLFEKDSIHLEKHYNSHIPEIWLKVNSMQQVFLNIISNALDAVRGSKKKEIRINVQRKGGFIQVTIADTGPGIVPKNIKKIFDPFFTTKPPGEGTGLGLAICQSIIEVHKGKLSCESTPGQGCTFEILLPIHKKFKRIHHEQTYISN
jgi:PAS domain S-box-containing protein